MCTYLILHVSDQNVLYLVRPTRLSPKRSSRSDKTVSQSTAASPHLEISDSEDDDVIVVDEEITLNLNTKPKETIDIGSAMWIFFPPKIFSKVLTKFYQLPDIFMCVNNGVPSIHLDTFLS